MTLPPEARPLPRLDAVAALAGERFVLLTTFRRTGRPVPTPVWVAGDGRALVVTTPRRSGKVARLRNDPTVELVPCSRTGRPRPGVAAVRGTATLVEGSRARPLARLVRRKYGLEHLLVMCLERCLAPRGTERVIVRITSA